MFDTVEVNATFHAVPPESTVRGWFEKVPTGFTFALKVPRAVTHDVALRLPDCEAVLDQFLAVARLLGDKLGPLLVQLPPSFHRTPANRRALAEFLDRLLQERLRVTVELRHPSWVDEAVERALAERNVAWVLADGGRTSRAAMFPADFAYVRFNRSGHEFEGYSEIQLDRSDDLDWWTRTLLGAPPTIRTVYVYMSNEFAGHAPASLRQLQQRLGLPPVDPRHHWPQRPLL